MAFQVRRFLFDNGSGNSIIRPADATAYAAGDQIANSTTAGSVINPTIDLSHFSRARVLRLGCDVTPASSNVVITAFDFAALIFHNIDVPAAVGDNITFPIAGVQRNKAAKFAFANGSWTQPNGALTAGASGFQEQLYALSANFEDGAIFDFTSRPDIAASSRKLALVLQAQGAWTPLAVVNTFNFYADIQLD